MANSSATGGYLLPDGAVAYDSVLEDALQAHIVGITGLPGQMVRPRWQPVTPKMPEPHENWAAVGVTNTKTDFSPALVQGDSSTKFIRHEILTVMVSFYGANAESLICRFRDGMQISQNNLSLLSIGAKFNSCDEYRPAPELLNMQWVRRFDMEYRLKRSVTRTYSILPLINPPDINTAQEQS